MKRVAVFFQIIIIFFLIPGGGKDTIETVSEIKSYRITAQEAKQMIDSKENVIILDVRSEKEHTEGHIKESILIPSNELENKAEEVLKEKNQKILVYCRSGNRSAKAAEVLSNMGYTQVYDFGGINNWNYGIEK